MAERETTSMLAVFSRIYWMLLGPMLLVVLAFTVVRTGNGWLTGADFAFLGVLAALILARWVEFQTGNPQTSEGTPATRDDLRRYVLGVAVVGLIVWVGTNVVGNYIL